MPSSDRVKPEVPFSSNDVRLSLGEWCIAIAVLAAVFVFTPKLWESAEKLVPAADTRQPYTLGNDYWLFGRYAREACNDGKCLVIGDSVVWGHYVEADQTLSSRLNQLADKAVFANCGLDGVHPAALAGLIDYYGRDIAHQKVLVQYNMLWTGNKRSDLQEKKESSINHPALIPQFAPKVPCYRETLNGKLANVIGRYVPMLGLARHLQMAYFSDAEEKTVDMPSWTMAHPLANPISAITFSLPSAVEMPSPPPDTRPWTAWNPEKVDFPWVELETSIQWASLQRTIETLLSRGNRLFVVVGPFNEHKLTDKSRAAYRQRLQGVDAWLSEHKVPHCIARLLPSEEYADGSHPLADGYARLANEVYEDKVFREFMNETGR
jgi:hypothetical protein